MLRLVLSPRWLMWHVLTLGAMITCGYLSAWQWHKAGTAMGSALNVGYGLQWPVFAVFFGVMWWRFLRLEVRALREAEDATDDARSGQPGAHPVPPAPDTATAQHAATGGNNGSAAASPFRRSPISARSVTDAEDPELAEYNRMLAALAEHDSH